MRSNLTTVKNLFIGEHEISLIRSTRRRTVTLEIDARGIRVRAPKRLPLTEIQQFIQSKEHWLQRQLNKLPALAEPITLGHGSTVSYQGEQLTVHLAEGRGSITYDPNGVLTIPIVASHLPTHETTRRKLVNWYKLRARMIFTEEVNYLQPVMQPQSTLPTLAIREYKRRWGSCSHGGNLSFNWRLVMAPPDIYRYVVIHELAHRQEFNHSKKFWSLVAKQDPSWLEHQAWLHDHGSELYRF